MMRDDAVHRVVDICVGTIVHSTVHQFHRRSVEKRIHEMAEDTRIARLLAGKVINARTDEIEGPDNRVVEALLEPIGVQDALEQAAWRRRRSSDDS